MRDRRKLVLKNVSNKSLRRQRRMASGKIGQADNLGPMLLLRRFLHEDFRLHRAVIASQHEFGCAHEFALLKRSSKAVWGLTAAARAHWLAYQWRLHWTIVTDVRAVMVITEFRREVNLVSCYDSRTTTAATEEPRVLI